MEHATIIKIEQATVFGRQETFRLGMALLFVVCVMFWTYVQHDGMTSGHMMLVVAAMMGGYMALNIGANDVANNVGPAVGSQALTMGGAILIAGVFEAGGALIAGGDVVSTIKKGIINPELISDKDTFIWLMMAALLAGAIWLNAATAMGAPVSTTHSIVGGVLGAGIAAGGWGIANWDKMAQIAASWVISPVLGGLIAALFLYLIKRTITYKKDMITAAKGMVPVLVGLMAWAFSTYLILKGIKKLIKIPFGQALLIGLVIAIVTYFIVKPLVARAASKLENSKSSVNSLFTVPLIFAAALLSFAHGANDVANAVGPLAAINDTLTTGVMASGKAGIPIWVMMIGALGIALGLALYGPKLIKTVGSEITELDQSRAFCIAMAAAITVIIASQLGLPVSSTHIAVGGIFGVGFLREYLKKTYAQKLEVIMDHHHGDDEAVVQQFLEDFQNAQLEEKKAMLERLKLHKKKDPEFSKKERRQLNKVYGEQLVKRSALMKIASAWIITVPLSGFLAAMLFYTIRGFMIP